jgi:hypothetical protein
MTDHDDKKPGGTPLGAARPGEGVHKLGEKHVDTRQHPAAGQETNARHDDDKKPDTHQGEHVSTFSPEQLATPAPNLAGSRQMYIIVGPYKGSVLTMPDAEAEDAKDSHWAVEMDTVAPPFDADKPPEHDHELSEEDRAYAVEAADAWAAKVNEPPDEPPPEGDETEAQREAREKRNADRKADHDRRTAEHGRRKAMHPGRQPGAGYETRTADHDPDGRPPSRNQPTPEPHKPEPTKK